jgi:hypothetical protein
MDVKNMDIRGQYRERAIQFANEWKSEFPDVTEHTINMMVSITNQTIHRDRFCKVAKVSVEDCILKYNLLNLIPTDKTIYRRILPYQSIDL